MKIKKNIFKLINLIKLYKLDLIFLFILLLLIFLVKSYSKVWANIPFMGLIVFFTITVPVYFNFFLVKKYLYINRAKYFLIILLFIFTLSASQFYLYNLLKIPDSEFLNLFINNCVIIILAQTINYSRSGFVNLYLNQELQVKNLEDELMLIESEINPKQIKEILTKINNINIKNDKDFSNVIMYFSDFMRYTTIHLKGEKIKLEDELEFIKSYTAFKFCLEETDNFFEFKILGDYNNVYIKSGIFYPIIECFLNNSILHKENTYLYCEIFKKNISFSCRSLANPFLIHELENNIKKNLSEKLYLAYPYRFDINLNSSNQDVILSVRIFT